MGCGGVEIEEAAEAGLADGGEDVALAEGADAADFALGVQVAKLGGAHAGGEPCFAGDIGAFLEPGAHGHEHEAGGGG